MFTSPFYQIVLVYCLSIIYYNNWNRSKYTMFLSEQPVLVEEKKKNILLIRTSSALWTDAKKKPHLIFNINIPSIQTIPKSTCKWLREGFHVFVNSFSFFIAGTSDQLSDHLSLVPLWWAQPLLKENQFNVHFWLVSFPHSLSAFNLPPDH